MSAHSPVNVVHDEANTRFAAEIDGHLAHADYTLDGTRMIFTHTFVPPELRGRGVAEQLVRPALAYARAHHFRVVPACSYVATFIQRHTEFADLLA
ncbi:GNAT family N-acetyltransferase [Rariglobus hedericola]|uniref:N-acetyltransferase n=1 Tax=Rariglobus hedericola TaxID=2597822 RepID=A0A556QKI9_9BACT|nr:GNAT family N-acetyltransferase [Rariglobus hedericola]TSJ77160.1 N-acetyltransferase [Rariglobus hedericola]